jgi:ABC-type transporter Mla subunit MlaD
MFRVWLQSLRTVCVDLAGGVSAAAQRITSGQLRDIGAMLARLTRENAALIKQRDKFEAAAAEAARAGAAADAAVAEREQLLQERVAAKAELDAAKADYSKAAASVRQLAAERDRLLQQVGSSRCAGSGKVVATGGR